MPPTSDFLAGSQIGVAQFKSRPRKIMSYLFQINQLALSECSTSGQQWELLLNYRILDERLAWPRATVEVAIDMNYRAQ